MHASTAILYFTRRPDAESKYKRLHRQTKSNQQIIRALYEHTHAMLHDTGLPVLEYNEDQQRGDRFGERLSFCVREAFALGYERLLIIGNDCPTLSRNDLKKAVAALSRGEQVMGATDDGGAWLIGLQRRQFEVAAFAALPWTSAHLAKALSAYLAKATPLQQLQQKQDLDHVGALQLAFAKYSTATIIKILRSLLRSFRTLISQLQRWTAAAFSFQTLLRGPPALHSL
ncbi:MAG: DUF2064 domain-containing protein [Bacteroidota bacterium]